MPNAQFASSITQHIKKLHAQILWYNQMKVTEFMHYNRVYVQQACKSAACRLAGKRWPRFRPLTEEAEGAVEVTRCFALESRLRRLLMVCFSWTIRGVSWGTVLQLLSEVGVPATWLCLACSSSNLCSSSNSVTHIMIAARCTYWRLIFVRPWRAHAF